MKLSDYVIDFLVEHGVKHVFMLPGGGAMHLNDSLGSRCREIEFVCNLHEQASAMAAETYAKATGHLGVALVTTGPGGTNTVTGVAGAWLDSTPVLFISGQAKRPDLKADSGVRQMGVQEVDIVSIVTPITKFAVTVLDPESIRFELEKAVYLAESGRPGPVWIDIPLDVQGATIEPAALRSFTPENEANGSDQTNLTAQVARVIDYLNQSERAVLLAGNGIRLARAERSFLELIERLRVPVLTTWLAVDLLPYDHKLYLGRPGTVAPRGVNFALQNSDLLLSIGSRIDFTITGYAPEKLARGAKKVMVDVDAAELRKLDSYFDLSLQVDAGDFIGELLSQSNKLQNRDRSPWMARCQEWKTKYPVVLPEHRNPDQRVSTYYLAEIFSEELKENEMIVSGSSGAGIEIFQLALKLKAGQRLFQTTALGAMGNGLPSAIGACLGSGRRETVCVDGDGGIQLNIQELATIQRLQLPIKLFILNNDGFSSIRTSQQRWFGRLMAADGTSGLTLPDITKVAAAYGLATARIESQRNLRKEVRAVLDTPGPVVCDVWCIPDEARMPSLASSQRADGSLVSKPLEDLWPFLDRDEFRANMIIPILEE
jgi:acetolactate synthase I/II/III large subunit